MTFDAAVFGAGATITLGGAALAITGEITIDGDSDGDGDGDVTISGNSLTRVINTSAVTTLNGVDIVDGMTTGNGGGIQATDELTLINSTVSGNTATGETSLGGGISGTNVTLINTTIQDNSTTGDTAAGGGVAVTGDVSASLTLINATVAGNSTSGANATGGGIASTGTTTTTITNSTITGNSTAGSSALGGGIAHAGFAVDTSTTPPSLVPTLLTVTNSIVSGNVTGYAGVGGDEISVVAAGAPAPVYIGGNLIGSTLLDDGIAHGSAISLGDVFDQTTEVLVDTDGDGTGETSSGVFGGVSADNGGSVQTVALAASSTNPVIDQGDGALPTDTQDLDDDMDTAEALPVDARGFARDVDVPGVGGTPDLGAFEAQTSQTPGPDLLGGTDGADIVFADQGGSENVSTGDGDDGIFFGAEFDPTDVVDAGEGDLDQIGLQGDYSGGVTFGPESTQNVEVVVLLPGSDTRFGASGTEMFNYDLTLVDENIPAGGELAFQANTLDPGESFTLDASAELDGSIFTYGGEGTDDLTGSQQDDSFFFGTGRFGPTDKVDGQGGDFDSIGLQGDYSGGIVFGEDQITDVEIIALLTNTDTRFGGAGSGTPYTYDLTMADGNVAPGETLGINGNTLASDESLTFDGSAETDGSYLVFSGDGNDTILGSQNNDIISGRGGGDTLTGNGGNDTFLYTNLSDSAPGAQDLITDFTAGDVISLTALDANTGMGGNQVFNFIGSAAFSGQAGELRAENTSGNQWLIEATNDGNIDVDFVLNVTTSDGDAITSTDFLL